MNGEAMIVCMLIPGISGRITMKPAALLLVMAPCCGLVSWYRRFGLHAASIYSVFWRSEYAVCSGETSLLFIYCCVVLYRAFCSLKTDRNLLFPFVCLFACLFVCSVFNDPIRNWGYVASFIFVVPCIVILGWINPTRCNSMQIFIYW